jgi:hypothetical protein
MTETHSKTISNDGVLGKILEIKTEEILSAVV